MQEREEKGNARRSVCISIRLSIHPPRPVIPPLESGYAEADDDQENETKKTGRARVGYQ